MRDNQKYVNQHKQIMRETVENILNNNKQAGTTKPKS